MNSLCTLRVGQQKMEQIKLFSAALYVIISSLRACSGFPGESMTNTAVPLSPPCDNDIYCHGHLLKTVQLASLYKDSKTFVDMKLRVSPAEVKANFNLLMNRYSQNPPKSSIQEFVDLNFDKPGSELEVWTPPDWKEQPDFLKNISDLKLRDWAKQLHGIWKVLGRKMKDEVQANPDRYSIIYVPNPVIVPGGRFLEFYYWDSYWIVRGLLISGMPQTVKGMLENFLSMVDKLGFVPNGGRVYFENRSQPPFLIPMVHSYLEATNDHDFVRKNFKVMEREFDYWLKNHTVTVVKNGATFNMARYDVKAGGPRPESFREDFILATENNLTSSEQDELYQNLKAGAESGWDYSSRWFVDPAGKDQSLLHLRTQDIIPVDLNGLLYLNAKTLAEWATDFGDNTKAVYYQNIANNLKEAVEKVLWNEEKGSWFDYDFVKKVQRIHFYPSNVLPLWTGCYDMNRKEQIVTKVMKYLEENQSVQYIGGVPSSLYQTGEQWDFPNSWAPLQYIVVMALDGTGILEAQEMAYNLANKWIHNNWESYLESIPHAMFEKYDCTSQGLPGGGGEYDVQTGFGWTNGVILEFINKYNKEISSCLEDNEEDNEHSRGVYSQAASLYSSTTSTVLVAITAASLTALAFGLLMWYKWRWNNFSFCSRWSSNQSSYTPLSTSEPNDETVVERANDSLTRTEELANQVA